MRVMEEGQCCVESVWRSSKRGREVMGVRTIIPQKGDDNVVAKGGQIEGVSEKEREPVISCDDGHQEELYDIEKQPDGQESADGDLAKSSTSAIWNERRERERVSKGYCLHQSNSQTPERRRARSLVGQIGLLSCFYPVVLLFLDPATFQPGRRRRWRRGVRLRESGRR